MSSEFTKERSDEYVFDRNILEFCNKDFSNKMEVISYLGTLLYNKGKITNAEEYIQAVLERESLLSTEVGFMIAIPHGISNCVKESFAAVLKLKMPMKWDEEDVQYIINLGIPKEKRANDHIDALAALSSHLMLEGFRESLYKAQNEKELFEVLNTIQIKGDSK